MQNDDFDTRFDLDQVTSLDEASLVIKHPKTRAPTTWTWTFYGPGHPRTIEVANRVSREMLQESRAQIEARINGKTWSAEDLTVDQLRDRNVENIIGRLKTFTPVRIGAETIEFSPDAARKLLLDRGKSWLFGQVIEFLKADENFIQASAPS